MVSENGNKTPSIWNVLPPIITHAREAWTPGRSERKTRRRIIGRSREVNERWRQRTIQNNMSFMKTWHWAVKNQMCEHRQVMKVYQGLRLARKRRVVLDSRWMTLWVRHYAGRHPFCWRWNSTDDAAATGQELLRVSGGRRWRRRLSNTELNLILVSLTVTEQLVLHQALGVSN